MKGLLHELTNMTKLEIDVNFSCSYSPGTLSSYLLIHAVNLSLRLKSTQEGNKVEKLGEQKNGLQKVKFQKQLIDYNFF